MPLDPHECHEQAKRCMKLAAETTDPNAQEILTTSAQRWERLAVKLADAEELLKQSSNGTNTSPDHDECRNRKRGRCGGDSNSVCSQVNLQGAD